MKRKVINSLRKKAEGDKQSAILEAEGKAEAIKKVAEADKYQEIAIAEGEAKAILMFTMLFTKETLLTI